jgi:25S rRNA (cytosine2278-C5)-methyltransferase
MSLYIDAANAISNSDKTGGSLKSRIYSGKTWHHPPHQIYALVGESIKWSPVLKEVIEKSELLKIERKVCVFF